MLIHKAAAWALVVTHLSLPVTFHASHALNVSPQTSTASARTISAETESTPTDVPSKDSDDPPSTSPDLSIENVLLASPTPTITPPLAGKSRATEEQERQLAEKKRLDDENQRKIVEKAKIEAQKRAETAKHIAAQKKLEISQREQSQPISQPKQASSVRIIGKSREQCVIYARRITGISAIQGYAGDIRSQGSEPRVGAGALERNYGHVSVVVAIDGDYLILHDANYIVGAITERRVHKSTQRGYIY